MPVCPVSAIFALDELPEKWKHYTELNASYVQGGKFTPEEYAKHNATSRRPKSQIIHRAFEAFRTLVLFVPPPKCGRTFPTDAFRLAAKPLQLSPGFVGRRTRRRSPPLAL